MTAQVSIDPSNGLWVEYKVEPRDAVKLAEWNHTGRADGLWRTTCFELFLRPQGGQSYHEYNFAPSGQWAAYSFDDYREGMRDLALREELELGHSWLGQSWWLDVEPILPDWSKAPFDVGLSAVIEEIDSTKSYWALRHPPGKPDFHHPDSFALTLEAPPPT